MDYIRLRRNNVICPNSLILMLIMSLSNIVPNIVSIIEESRFHFAFDERPAFPSSRAEDYLVVSMY